MGCDCTKTTGFREQMAKAKAETERTGETHVVFVQKAVGMAFMCKESVLTDDFGICCYYLPTGQEVVYKPKNIEQIEVNEPEEVATKTKK